MAFELGQNIVRVLICKGIFNGCAYKYLNFVLKMANFQFNTRGLNVYLY